MQWFFHAFLISLKNNILFFQMKCLLCNLNFANNENLRSHYIWQHLINEDNNHFKDLFAPGTNFKGCDICMLDFKNSRIKKNNMFLLHCTQTGGSRTDQQLPVNILRRGPVKHFSINYQQHKNLRF